MALLAFEERSEFFGIEGAEGIEDGQESHAHVHTHTPGITADAVEHDGHALPHSHDGGKTFHTHE